MMRNKWVILLLFLTGLGILLFPYILEKIDTTKHVDQVEEFRKEIVEKEEEEIDQELDKLKSCYKEAYYDENGIHDPFEKSNEKLNQFRECLGIEEDEIFAALEIPKLDLTIPIYLGSSDDILMKGIGQVEGSSLPLGGNSTHTVLAGHRGMATMFRDIDDLHEGDVLYIHGNTGTLKYLVTQQRVIYPDETSSLEIEEGKDLITLLTCHPFRYNYQRLLIHAKRAEEVAEGSETNEENSKAESEIKKENNKANVIVKSSKILRFWRRNDKIIIISLIVLLPFMAFILFRKRKE